MDKPKIDNSLLVTNREFEKSKNNNVAAQKRKLTKYIIESLYVSTETYDVESSLKAIENYIKKQTTVGRLMYFEITSAVFQDTEERRARAMANSGKLVEYVYTDYFMEDKNKYKEKDKYQEIATKIYDHFNLANYQIHAITKEALKRSKEKFEKQTSKTLRKAEKNYVTILGIFASIIMAAVGSFNYTTAALGALSSKDIHYSYIIGMVTLLGVVLVAIMDILTKIIFRMTKVEEDWRSLLFHGGAVAATGILIALLVK